jgi:type II secretion system protein G
MTSTPRQPFPWIILSVIVALVLLVVSALSWASLHSSNSLGVQRYLDKNVKGGERSQAYFYIDDCICPMLQRYYNDMGEYPSTEEGILALFHAPKGKTDKWHGPYIETEDKELPVDPWGSRYQYQCPGVHHPQGYDVWSFGPDKKPGTADDLGNW